MKHLDKIGFLILLLGISAGDSEALWFPVALIGIGTLIMWISKRSKQWQKR